MTLVSEEPPELPSRQPEDNDAPAQDVPTKKRNVAQLLQIAIAALVVVGSIIWFITDPGYEQPLVALAAVATLAADLKGHALVKWVVAAGGLLFVIGVGYVLVTDLLSKEPTALTVRVTDVDGRPIPGAQVRLFYGADYTNKSTGGDGTAVLLADPKVSRGTLIVESLEHLVHEQTVNLTAEQFIPVVLQREDGIQHTAIVRVRDAAKGRTVPDAEVEIIAGGDVFTGASDNSGLARFLLDFPDDTLTVELTVRYGGDEVSSAVTLRRNIVQDVVVETETESVKTSPIEPDEATAEDRYYDGPRPLGYDILTNGAFASSTEFHLYYISVDSGDTVIAEAEPGEGTCVGLELLDPSNVRLSQSRDRSRPWNAELRTTVTEAGRHTLLAKACGQASGSYSLFITRVPAAP